MKQQPTSRRCSACSAATAARLGVVFPVDRVRGRTERIVANNRVVANADDVRSLSYRLTPPDKRTKGCLTARRREDRES